MFNCRGEEGLDYGGVAREWFFTVSHEVTMFSFSPPSSALFSFCPTSSPWFIVSGFLYYNSIVTHCVTSYWFLLYFNTRPFLHRCWTQCTACSSTPTRTTIRFKSTRPPMSTLTTCTTSNSSVNIVVNHKQEQTQKINFVELGRISLWSGQKIKSVFRSIHSNGVVPWQIHLQRVHYAVLQENAKQARILFWLKNFWNTLIIVLWISLPLSINYNCNTTALRVYTHPWSIS